MRTLQISTKAYCAGVVLDGKGKCVDAAPILRWMIGKGEQWIKFHCRKHNMRVEEVGDSTALRDKELTNKVG